MNMKLIAVLVLVLVGLVIARSLLRRDADEGSRLSLDDLLLGDDGKMSKAAAVMLGAFLVTTWMMIWLTMQAKMTEGYLAIYVAAWITPTVTRLIKGTDPNAAPVKS
jgi:hypothetical protein